MGRSLTVFVVMVSVAATGWILTVVALAGGWKKLFAVSTERATIVSIAAFALLSTLVLSIVVYRGTVRTERVQTRVSERKATRYPDKKLLATNTKAPTQIPIPIPIPIPKASAKPPMRPMASVALPPRIAMPKHKKESPIKEEAKRRDTDVARTRVENIAKPVRVILPPPEAPPEKTNAVVRGATVLSDLQAKWVCGEVGLYAGAQVYIKWSPGATAEQFARQFSKIMDCAGVTVTYASEAAGLAGHGVRVGFHANEGETSDRLRPFADAITAALREQGFNVAEVSSSGIPTDQTAIFVGPE